ncbi:hypothetical protein [Streptomyces sp. NPDC002533]
MPCGQTIDPYENLEAPFMTVRIRNRKAVFLVSAALVSATTLASLHGWWNTNVWGAEAFCADMLTSGEVQAALVGRGRLSETYSRADAAHTECTVERTSRFPGTADARMTVKTGTAHGAFPFTTAVWKNPAERAYFADGAVSDSHGYVVLPKACWPPAQETVATVEVTMEDGSADREGLARLLARVSQKVAAAAGCSDGDTGKFDGLSMPAAPRTTDPGRVCGLKGFSLPEKTVVDGVAEPGQEQLNEASPHWACDLSLDGTSGSRLSFAATSDPTLISAALRDRGRFKAIPGGKGYADLTRAVLRCEKGDVFFAAKWNTDYSGVLLDQTRNSTPSYAEVRRTTFQDFLDVAAPARSCPKVALTDMD